MNKTTLPNLITALRIAGTAGLLFTVPLTPLFFVIYTLCGLSDVLDGWLARHTGAAMTSAQGWTALPTCCFTR